MVPDRERESGATPGAHEGAEETRTGASASVHAAALVALAAARWPPPVTSISGAAGVVLVAGAVLVARARLGSGGRG
ncbi:MAG: hypothetical protein D6683_13350, partial [Actinomyces sp.]